MLGRPGRAAPSTTQSPCTSATPRTRAGQSSRPLRSEQRASQQEMTTGRLTRACMNNQQEMITRLHVRMHKCTTVHQSEIWSACTEVQKFIQSCTQLYTYAGYRQPSTHTLNKDIQYRKIHFRSTISLLFRWLIIVKTWNMSKRAYICRMKCDAVYEQQSLRTHILSSSLRVRIL